MARNALRISSWEAFAATPRSAVAQGLLPAGGGATERASSVRGLRGFGCGACPRSTRTHVPAQRASTSTRACPAARSACLRASSRERAPPLEASGGRNGSASGAPLHHAAHKKRRRRVGTTEKTPVKREVVMVFVLSSRPREHGLAGGQRSRGRTLPHDARGASTPRGGRPPRERMGDTRGAGSPLRGRVVESRMSRGPRGRRDRADRTVRSNGSHLAVISPLPGRFRR